MNEIDIDSELEQIQSDIKEGIYIALALKVHEGEEISKGIYRDLLEEYYEAEDLANYWYLRYILEKAKNIFQQNGGMSK